MSHDRFGCYLQAAAGAVALLAIAGQANATTISMADLLAGGSIACGDKTFFHFHDFLSVGTNGAVAPTASQVFGTETDCGTNKPGPGIIWQSPNWNVNPTQDIDTSWSYDVIVNSGAKRIIDASMEFLSATADNGADIHITESLFNSTPAFVNSLLIDLVVGPQIDIHDPLPGGPYSFLSVNKDVSLEGHATGNASLSTFKQNFSQVPEPATLPLLGGALIAFAFASRKFGRKPRYDAAG